MATKRSAGALHILTAREIVAAGEGDHVDGGGLQLRRRGDAASSVFRYTSPTGRRREMGLGVARLGSLALAADSLTSARKLARDARDQLERSVDPLDARRGQRDVAKAEADAKKAKKVRQALTLAHRRPHPGDAKGQRLWHQGKESDAR